MLKLTLKYLNSLLHVSVHLDYPQGAYTEPIYEPELILVSFAVLWMLPQHCKTYNDVFLLITSTKV